MDKNIDNARRVIENADALLIGASNGLSISEGYNIFADNEMFRSQFGDFRDRYGIRSVLDGVFGKHMPKNDYDLFVKRLVRLWVDDYKPTQVMTDLRSIVTDKPYFVLTTNADEHLEKAGFSPENVWEIEGTFRDLITGDAPKDKQSQLSEFLRNWHNQRIVFLELGIGSRNRLIKLPMMQLAVREPNASYITLNLPHEIYIPEELSSKSVGISGDIRENLELLNK